MISCSWFERYLEKKVGWLEWADEIEAEGYIVLYRFGAKQRHQGGRFGSHL